MRNPAIAWCAALAVLVGALIFFNLPGPAPATAARVEADAPAGSEPGQQPADFTLTCLDGTAFALSQHRGQVTVINLWATWCAPCVSELPLFDRLQRENPEDVAVLAIHSDLVTDDVAKYVSGFDYRIPFAVDADGAVIASLGGSTMLPQTIVLDRCGIVVYNRVGSVTWEALSQIVEQARGNGDCG